MISTIEHIEYLLINHDCVILPNWGAFLSNYTPAVFDEETGDIVPPVRTISFNESIKQNDGLLANSISHKKSVSYAVAISAINTDVESFKIQLNHSGELQFGNLGMFKLNQNGSLLFEPNSNLGISSFYGLVGFKLQPLTNRAKAVETEDSGLNNENIKESFIHKSLRYASSIVLLIGLLFALSTPAEINLNNTELASLNIIKQKKELAKQIENYKGELLLSLPPESAHETVNLNRITYSDSNNIDKYYLVVASFPTQEDAISHINNTSKLKGSKILKSKKVYRVYIASANDIESLSEYKVANNIADKFEGSWICRK